MTNVIQNHQELKQFLSRFDMPLWMPCKWSCFPWQAALGGVGLVELRFYELRDRDSGRPMELGFSKSWNVMDLTQAYATVQARAQIMDFLSHEVDEHLQFDGARLFEPHTENGALRTGWNSYISERFG